MFLGFLQVGSSLTFPSIVFAAAEANSTNIFGHPFILSANEKDMMGIFNINSQNLVYRI